MGSVIKMGKKVLGSVLGISDGGDGGAAAAQQQAAAQKAQYDKQISDIAEANKLAANKSINDTVKVEVGGDATASSDLLGEVKKKRTVNSNSSSLGLG